MKPSPQPTPDPPHDSGAAAIARIVVVTPAFLFTTTTGNDLLRRPFIQPEDFSGSYPVMRLASLLPVPHGGVQTRPPGMLLERPFGWTQRRSDLRSTTAGAEMRGRSEFLGYIEDPWLQILRHVVDSLQPNLHAPGIQRLPSDRKRRIGGGGGDYPPDRIRGAACNG